MKDEKQIELSFIKKLEELKYVYREDIKDKAALEENFRKHASEYFEKGKRQNTLLPKHIDRIIETYQYRKEDDKKYSRRVSMEEIEKNGYNLNISRYVSTAFEEEAVDIDSVRQELEKIEGSIQKAKARHNQFLQELGLGPIP